MTSQIFICKDTKKVGVLYSGTGYVIISKNSEINIIQNVNEWSYKLLGREEPSTGQVIKRVFGEINTIPKDLYDPNEIVYELNNSTLAFTFEDKNEYTKIPKMYTDDDLAITTIGCSQIFIEDSDEVTIKKQFLDERTLATCEFRFNVYPDQHHKHFIKAESASQIIIKAATLPSTKKPFECPKCSHETFDPNEFVLVNKRMICKNCI